jgi:hypothetical protein
MNGGHYSVGYIDQPTTRRENRSSTTDRYSQPSPVHRYVMSPDQAASGLSTRKSWPSLLGATGSGWSESVVTANRRGAGP